MRNLLAACATAAILSACSTSGGSLPTTNRLPLQADARNATAERFAQDSQLGVQRVRVPGSSMRAVSSRPQVKAATRSRPVRVEFGGQGATMRDLADALTALDVQIAFRWQNASSEQILQRRLPFTRFNGDLGGLLDALRTGMNVVAWQEGDIVFLSDSDKYTVVLPQNEEILASISASLTSLGATEVVTSLDGGKILYTAPPSLQDEVLAPFLQRATRNLSTITMQVAVVSLALNDNSSQGFDWARFSAMVDGRESAIRTAEGRGAAAPTGGADTGTSASNGAAGSVINLTQNALSLGTTNVGSIFGMKAVASVSGAIEFLSSFGNTNVTQHVDLRTLSGKNVRIRSGQSIPYVKSVGAVANGGGATTASSSTETVETGLTVELTPRFDADSELVTVDVDMQLSSIIEFLELSAGDQLGTLTQPRTQEQELTDIVQIRAGQTVVIGGLQYDQEQYSGNEPTFMRDIMRKSSASFGLRSQDVTRNSLFIIMRPTVTIYEPDGGAAMGAMVTK